MRDHEEGSWNDTAGIIDETIIGPYDFTGQIRIFGLAANRADLEKFLEAYLNETLDGSDVTFKLAEMAIVYLAVTDFNNLAGSRGVGEFTNRSCHFHIPVVCMRKGKDSINGSVQIFSFGSNMQNVITSNEVRGPIMAHAKIEVGTWIDDPDIGEAERMYKLSAQVINKNQKVDYKQLLTIHKTKTPHPLNIETLLDSWGYDNNRDFLKQKSAEIEGLIDDTLRGYWKKIIGFIDVVPDKQLNFFTEMLFTYMTNKMDPKYWKDSDITTIFALKQFQHETFPNKVSYQSLIQIPHSVTSKNQKIPVKTSWILAKDKDLAKIEVRIKKFSDQPIVEALGLVGREKTKGDDSIECILNPILYVLVEAKKDEEGTSFHEALGKTMCYRSDMSGKKNGWKNVSKTQV